MSYAISRKLKNLVKKAAKIKEESRLLSVMIDWPGYDEKYVNNPAFGNLTQALA